MYGRAFHRKGDPRVTMRVIWGGLQCVTMMDIKYYLAACVYLFGLDIVFVG